MAEVDAEVVTPVVTEAPASTDAPAPESTAEQVAAPEGETKPEAQEPEKTLTQSEVNKLMAKTRAQAERNALKVARAQVEAEYLRKEVEQLRQPPKPAEQGAPNPKDFQDYETYTRAMVRWEIQQEQKASQEKSQRETATEREQREMSEKAKYVHDTVVSKGRAKYPDFDEVAFADGVQITEAMIAAATRLKGGADAIYHLGGHPEEASRIAALHPIEQAWEMRDLESKLTAAPKPTSTPAPIVPNKASASTERKLEEAGSYDEFVAIRKKQIAARRGQWK